MSQHPQRGSKPIVNSSFRGFNAFPPPPRPRPLWAPDLCMVPAKHSQATSIKINKSFKKKNAPHLQKFLAAFSGAAMVNDGHDSLQTVGDSPGCAPHTLLPLSNSETNSLKKKLEWELQFLTGPMAHAAFRSHVVG